MKLLLVLALFSSGCFAASAPVRSYYVLEAIPGSPPVAPPMQGLLRVRNLDAASAYDKFQIVVRKSPYELRYSQSDVWAVKPNRMLSDVIAQALADAGTFTSVSRELGETRPSFTLDGDLHALEVYDSDDLWFAHLSFSLRLTDFNDGQVLWHFSFDERKQVHSRTFSHAARVMSELLSTALERAMTSLTRMSRRGTSAPEERQPPGIDEAPPPPGAPPEEEIPDPIYVPETPSPEPQ